MGWTTTENKNKFILLDHVTNEGVLQWFLLGKAGVCFLRIY